MGDAVLRDLGFPPREVLGLEIGSHDSLWLTTGGTMAGLGGAGEALHAHPHLGKIGSHHLNLQRLRRACRTGLLTDPENRHLATEHLVLGEKESVEPVLAALRAEFGVSTFLSRGNPRLVSTEWLSKDLRRLLAGRPAGTGSRGSSEARQQDSCRHRTPGAEMCWIAVTGSFADETIRQEVVRYLQMHEMDELLEPFRQVLRERELA